MWLTSKRTGFCLIIWTVLVSVIFICVLFPTITYEKLIYNIIKSKMVFTPGSILHKIWTDGEKSNFMYLYVFNCTNPEGVYQGESPNLQEIGPFVYEKQTLRTNYVFEPAEEPLTVEYEGKIHYYFRREMSVADEDNVEITTLDVASATLYYVSNRSDLTGLGREIFVQKTVKQILWGYYDMGLSVTVGLFPNKNGTTKKRIRSQTGLQDIRNLGQVVAVANKSSNNIWTSEKANEIRGTEGNYFPPGSSFKDKLVIYSEDLCRWFSLTPGKVTTACNNVNIPVLEFDLNLAQNDNQEMEEEFCPRDPLPPGCPPRGIIPVYKCLNLNIIPPVYVSHPHFYGAPQSIRKQFTGLKEPDRDEDVIKIYYEPNTFMGLEANRRLQINVYIDNENHVQFLRNMGGPFFFPIVWFNDMSIVGDSQLDLIYSMIVYPKFVLSIVLPVLAATIGCVLLASIGLLIKRHLILRSMYKGSVTLTVQNILTSVPNSQYAGNGKEFTNMMQELK